MNRIIKVILIGVFVVGITHLDARADSETTMTDQDFERLAQEVSPFEESTSSQVTEETRELREDQIPVLAAHNQTTPVKTAQSHRLLWSLGIVAVAGLLIVMAARYWSKRRPGLSSHNQIKVITQYSLGPKKSLAIVRVAGESILIGITDQNISMLKSLSLLDEDLPEHVPTSFDSELTDQELGGALGEDQFYVSKLKSMRPS